MSTLRRVGSAIGLTLGLVMAAPASGGDADVARVRLSPGGVRAVARSLLPAIVRLPPGPAGGPRSFRMTDVEYCGARKGAARLRGAGWLPGGEDKPAIGLSCQGGLAELAERAPGMGEGAVLVDLEASFKGWELTLAGKQAVVMGKDGRAQLSAGDQRFEVGSVSTADLRIGDDGAPVILHASPAFDARGAEVALLIADQAPAKAPRTGGGELGVSAQANAAIVLPVVVANQILRTLTARGPLSIPVDREQVDVRGLALASAGTGETGRLTLTGAATARSLREDSQWTLVASGHPLRVATVTVRPQHEDCARLGTLAAIGCNVRNGARTAATEAFARSATQRYQGQSLHELGSPFELRLNVGGQPVVVAGDLVRTWLSGRALTALVRIDTPR
jgi:hypothetical protein